MQSDSVAVRVAKHGDLPHTAGHFERRNARLAAQALRLVQAGLQVVHSYVHHQIVGRHLAAGLNDAAGDPALRRLDVVVLRERRGRSDVFDLPAEQLRLELPQLGGVPAAELEIRYRIWHWVLLFIASNPYCTPRIRVNTPACLDDRMICETSLASVEDNRVNRADVPQPVTYSNGAMASVAACLGRSYSVVLVGPNIRNPRFTLRQDCPTKLRNCPQTVACAGRWASRKSRSWA